jgi:hypothetical protein
MFSIKIVEEKETHFTSGILTVFKIIKQDCYCYISEFTLFAISHGLLSTTAIKKDKKKDF